MNGTLDLTKLSRDSGDEREKGGVHSVRCKRKGVEMYLLQVEENIRTIHAQGSVD